MKTEYIEKGDEVYVGGKREYLTESPVIIQKFHGITPEGFFIVEDEEGFLGEWKYIKKVEKKKVYVKSCLDTMKELVDRGYISFQNGQWKSLEFPYIFYNDYWCNCGYEFAPLRMKFLPHWLLEEK